MADFVCQYGLHLIRREPLEQALADRNQCVVLVPAGSERVGFIRRKNTDFRHLDARIAGQLFNSLQQPLLMASTWLGDDLSTGAHFRHPLGDEQREQRTGETEHSAEDQQLIEVQINPVGRHEPIEAKKAQGDAGNQHDRKVSGQKQQNAHHGRNVLLRYKYVTRCRVYKVMTVAIQHRDYFKLCPLLQTNDNPVKLNGA